MASRDRTNNALQIIFSFFLGLMVLAFIGIGVNTFYPQPKTYDDQLEKLYQEQSRVGGKDGISTPAEEAQMKRLDDQISELQKKQRAEMEIWARNTSIVLIVFATLVMAISLVRSEQLRVISNGLLLGGLFTMVYGVGWVLFSGQSAMRFFVILFAFAITLGLGYLKFVRDREARAEIVPASGAAQGAIVAEEVSARLDAIERRLDAAAGALGRPERHDG